MRIEQNLSPLSLNSLYDTSANRDYANNSQKPDIDHISDIEELKKQNNPAQESVQEKDEEEDLKHLKKERQTYGLMILELMSDEEYAAFQRATAGMSEGEKIMAAQSLYALTEFYQGRIQPSKTKNPYIKATIGDSQEFIEKYKAFYNGAQKVDILS